MGQGKEPDQPKFYQKKRNILLMTITPLLILTIGVGIYFFTIYNKAEEAVDDAFQEVDRGKTEEDHGKSDLRPEKVDPKIDDVSILFIGTDNSEQRNYQMERSDALILATLNNETKTIKMVSIPRDSYVYIPQFEYYDKANAAYAYGGVDATVGMVENLLEVPVDYYVSINFDAFVDVVDSLGGINVEVPYEFTESNSKDNSDSIHLIPGEQELNGEEALALARTRKLDNDFERNKRQQEIMKALLNKTISIGSIPQYDNLIDAVGDNMKTNLTFDKIKSFVSYATSKQLTFETIELTGGSDIVNDVWYHLIDNESLANTQQELKENLNIIDKSETSASSAEDRPRS